MLFVTLCRSYLSYSDLSFPNVWMGKKTNSRKKFSEWILYFCLLFGSTLCQAMDTLNEDDVSSQDKIILALYSSVSGGKGVAKDRFRHLFSPNARLVMTGKSADGSMQLINLSVEQYIENTMGQVFFETEVHRVSESYANIAQVFSTFEVRLIKEDKAPLMRGLTSIQLLNDGKRWWIVNVFWQTESKETPIPDRYLRH